MKHKYGTDFLIYSKSNMDVTKELKARLKDVRDRQKKGLPEDKNITLLSSRRFSQSFTPLDAISFYHKRQQIENAGFRELKQGYNIGNFPSRKYNGVFFHVLFTLTIFNFVTAFKTEIGGKTATLGLRRLHRSISFVGIILHAWPHFGLFHPNEVLSWTGYAGKGYRGPP